MYLEYKKTNDTIDDAYQKFGHAIVLQAVKDYRSALKSLKQSPGNIAASSMKHDAERFFHSGLYSAITSLDPEMLIAKLNEEVSAV